MLEYDICILFFLSYILGAFAELRKATISFAVSVCMEQRNSHWTDFHEIWYLSINGKSVEKFKFH